MDRTLVVRYLRQLAELGGPEVFLDAMTSADALRAAAGAGQGAAPPAPELDSPETRDGPATPATTDDTDRAAAMQTLSVLGQDAAGCTRCRLHEGRNHVVFGEGDARAEVVVVGEAPGQEEDRTGRPFVGRAGKMLDLLLMTAGFPRETVYICNVLKCRPPNNRNPLPDEAGTCTSTFLHPQLDAISPKVLVAVGKFAAQALLNSEASIGRLRGRVHSCKGTPLVVTYHPAYLLRSPEMNREAWQDFQLVRTVIDEQA